MNVSICPSPLYRSHVSDKEVTANHHSFTLTIIEYSANEIIPAYKRFLFLNKGVAQKWYPKSKLSSIWIVRILQDHSQLHWMFFPCCLGHLSCCHYFLHMTVIKAFDRYFSFVRMCCSILVFLKPTVTKDLISISMHICS